MGLGAHSLLAATTTSLLAGLTPRQLAVDAVLAVLFGWLGWRISKSFAATRGVTPWRLPSVVWGIICFLLMVVGLILELVAQLTTRSGAVGSSAPGAARPPASPPYGQTPLAGAPPSTWQGAVIRPQQGERDPAASRLVGADGAAVAPLAAEPVRLPSPPPGRDGSTALFGWYADVTARHELRYWDGRGWTELVRDGGVAGRDPLEDGKPSS